jgi:hypothetical protein
MKRMMVAAAVIAAALVGCGARNADPGPITPPLRATYDKFKGKTSIGSADTSYSSLRPSIACPGHATHCPTKIVYLALDAWNNERPTPWGDFTDGSIYFLGDDSVRFTGQIQDVTVASYPKDDLYIQSGVLALPAPEFARLAATKSLAIRYGGADSARCLVPAEMRLLRALAARIDQ